ncbi:MAG: exodeoxyribonuclease VII small subunit [Bacilli bacterium]|nr:exodeoxyribonuclease VII small subunit [Bacilli bacterium]
MAKEEKKFEELLNEVEEIVTSLENGNVDLDESIKKYTEAMEKVKLCSEKLESATKTVNKILTENGKLEDLEIE